MKFNEEKKRSIIMYLLEKIAKKSDDISLQVADTFGVNRNTVHTYIKQLVDANVIKRVKRGEYELVSESFLYDFKRSEGHLDSDTYIYENFFKKHINELPDNVKTMWAYSFSEMMNNVMDHSQAENVKLVVKCNCLNTSVLIIDDGVGIFEKIRNHFDYETLDDAICELFKGKLTTDSSRHSGEGIFFSSKIMDEFMILSSRKVFTADKYDENHIANLIGDIPGGTAVFMAVSNFSNKNVTEIFDMYSDLDSGFTKTVIPVKNVFDISPVSRSQARRICNRLDKFTEVVLDFEGVGWMGQGFAHQIFVVFSCEHPEISLIPINMNEAVSRMYNHVIRS